MILQTPHEVYNYVPPRGQTQNRKGMKPTFKAIILWHIALLCYQMCHSMCKGETFVATIAGKEYDMVDLSYEFNSETIYYGSGKPLTVTVTHNGTADDGNYWYQVEEIAAATHGGTHMDAPCHFARGRWCVSDIPPTKLVAPAVVIDISPQVEDDPTAHLKTEDLTAWESVHGHIPDGAVLLLRTGWSKFWPDKLHYTGTSGNNPNDMNYPSVEPDVAQWIVDNRNIVGFGIDTLGLDVPRSPDMKTHQILEDKNIYGLENLNGNLKLLPPTGSTVFVMPMKLKDASGAPCRVFATIPKSDSSGAACQTHSCHTIVTIVTLCGIYLIWSRSFL